MSERVYDHVVIGGGTAGAVVAARLAEDGSRSVCVIEGGPSDVGDPRVLQLRDWFSLLETELDYDYTTVEQPRGNSHIRHARGRVLGGCSSHNTMISFRPLPGDWSDWVERGCPGWDAETMQPLYDRLQNVIAPVAVKDRNAVAVDFLQAAHAALGVPVIEDFNAAPFRDGVGFFSVAYTPADGVRSSSSVAYLHPLLGRDNLTLLTETRAMRLVLDEGRRAVAVEVRRADGSSETIRTAGEIVLCAGSVDSARLLMLSGIGNPQDLRGVGIEPVVDLPGVGENLIDHPESIVMWQTKAPLGPETVMDFDAGLFVRLSESSESPDLMYHFCQVPFMLHLARLGYEEPPHAVCMTPNVPKSRSVGSMWLTSSDPDVKPALDPRYFTDADGHDEQVIVEGIKLARRVAATEPLAQWISHEVAPGPDVTRDEDLSAYGRAVSHTVYHPCGTCRMGSDEGAVVDAQLRVRGGIAGLRVADSSIFPNMPTVNPVVMTLMIGERAADLVKAAEREGALAAGGS